MKAIENSIDIKLPTLSYDSSLLDIQEGKSSFDLTNFCTLFCHAFNARNPHLSQNQQKDYFAITIRAMQSLVFSRDEGKTVKTLQNALLVDNPDLSIEQLTKLVKLINFHSGDDLDILATIVARQLKSFIKAGVTEEDARMTLLDNWYADTVFKVINDVYFIQDD